jgi:hypothetical protein
MRVFRLPSQSSRYAHGRTNDQRSSRSHELYHSQTTVFYKDPLTSRLRIGWLASIAIKLIDLSMCLTAISQRAS